MKQTAHATLLSLEMQDIEGGHFRCARNCTRNFARNPCIFNHLFGHEITSEIFLSASDRKHANRQFDETLYHMSDFLGECLYAMYSELGAYG